MSGLTIFGMVFTLYWLWVAYEFWRAPLMEEQPDGSWKTIKPTKKLKDLFKKK
jgi:hypothetical protein